ncbi:MAG: hypothetical protein ACOCX5_00165 [Chloroflexota bacterium]
MDIDFGTIDFCPRCQYGRMQPRPTTLVTFMDKRVVSMPDMSAYVCDTCHYLEFEAEALNQFEALMGWSDEETAGELRLPVRPSLVRESEEDRPTKKTDNPSRY